MALIEAQAAIGQPMWFVDFGGVLAYGDLIVEVDSDATQLSAMAPAKSPQSGLLQAVSGCSLVPVVISAQPTPVGVLWAKTSKGNVLEATLIMTPVNPPSFYAGGVREAGGGPADAQIPPPAPRPALQVPVGVPLRGPSGVGGISNVPGFGG